jgi:hypothetical protein
VQPDTVFAIADRLATAGVAEIGFGDTTGMACGTSSAWPSSACRASS